MSIMNNNGTDQSDQRICCSLPGLCNTSTCYSRNFKTLATVCGWAGRFESNLVANPKTGFLKTWLKGSQEAIFNKFDKKKIQLLERTADFHFCQTLKIWSDTRGGGVGTPILGHYGYVLPESPPIFSVWVAPKDWLHFFGMDCSERPFSKIYLYLLLLVPKFPSFCSEGPLWKPPIFSDGQLPKSPIFQLWAAHIYHFHIWVPSPGSDTSFTNSKSQIKRHFEIFLSQ